MVVSYDPLYFCVVCCDHSIFISNFLIWFFSLCFLMSLTNGLSILFILSKNQLLALLIFAIFAIVSFVSFVFISALNFKISFLLLTLGFIISSFSSCFRCRVRLFIPVFLSGEFHGQRSLEGCSPQGHKSTKRLTQH